MDDAHRLGLLRAVGPIYQIRHAEFHDYLAATYEPPPKVKPRAPAVVRHLATSLGRTTR
jgi:hypothetical protein